MRYHYFTPVLGLLLMFTPPCFAEQKHRSDEQTGIQTWELSSQGISLSVTQILPQQLRAFYVNRGFDVEAIEAYARSCVFMAVLRNDKAPGVVHFRLSDWRVSGTEAQHPPLSADHWLAQPAITEAPKPARLAFRWAQFPPEQSYQPGGDWNQGMLSAGLAAGDRFDLQIRWDVAGEGYTDVIKGIQCAN